jgi:hypothetical protein
VAPNVLGISITPIVAILLKVCLNALGVATVILSVALLNTTPRRMNVGPFSEKKVLQIHFLQMVGPCIPPGINMLDINHA